DLLEPSAECARVKTYDPAAAMPFVREQFFNTMKGFVHSPAAPPLPVSVTPNSVFVDLQEAELAKCVSGTPSSSLTPGSDGTKLGKLNELLAASGMLTRTAPGSHAACANTPDCAASEVCINGECVNSIGSNVACADTAACVAAGFSSDVCFDG